MSVALKIIQAKLLAPAQPKEMGGLYSFHYFRDTHLGEFLEKMAANGYQPEVFTDSGGFSAFSQGVKVEIDDYARFLLKWRSLLDHYANLDVIGDPKASLRNLMRLEARGLRPLPVIHVGTDPEEIRRYKARGYARQCLGGMVPSLTQMAGSLRSKSPFTPNEWAARCHEIAKEEGVLLHGFGATNLPVMQEWPWASVDSSSWASGFRFGNVVAFDPIKGQLIRLSLRDVPKLMANARLLRFYGVEPLDLIRDGMEIRIAMLTLTVRSHLAMVRWLKEKKTVRSDFRLFMADSVDSGHDARALALVLGSPPSPR